MVMSKFVLLEGTKGVYKFWCEGCKTEHQVWTDAQDGVDPWMWNKDTERPTVSPSVLVNADLFGQRNPNQPVCHSFIKDGMIQYLNDCTHELAGRTVELKEIE